MATDEIASTLKSVNKLFLEAGYAHCVGTIADRIDKALAERGWSQRQLAEACGYATQSHVGNTLRRLRADPDAVELRTITVLARGLGVSRHWLLTGVGLPTDAEPSDGVPHSSDRLRNRAAVLAFFSDVDPRALRWLAAISGDGADKSRVEWTELLLLKLRELAILDAQYASVKR